MFRLGLAVVEGRDEVRYSMSWQSGWVMLGYGQMWQGSRGWLRSVEVRSGSQGM